MGGCPLRHAPAQECPAAAGAWLSRATVDTELCLLAAGAQLGVEVVTQG